MSTHHATVVISLDAAAVASRFRDVHKEAEVVAVSYAVCSIIDVRQLISMAYQSAGAYSYRLFIITAEALAPEAQQALLKLLEEPPAETHFLFILPRASSLLPTVLSRVLLLSDSHLPSAVDERLLSAVRTFVTATVPARLALIATATKKKDDEWFSVMNKGLVLYLQQPAVQLPVSVIETVQQCLMYLGLRGASKKMLWEEIALSLPVETVEVPTVS